MQPNPCSPDHSPAWKLVLRYCSFTLERRSPWKLAELCLTPASQTPAQPSLGHYRPQHKLICATSLHPFPRVTAHAVIAQGSLTAPSVSHARGLPASSADRCTPETVRGVPDARACTAWVPSSLQAEPGLLGLL